MMKIKILIFLVVALIFSSIYFVSDSKLYYYGKSDHNVFKNTLPLNLNPDYLGSRVSYPIIGFTISDEYGLIKIGKDVTLNFDAETIKIKKVVRYGFNNKVIVTVIEALDGNIYNIKLSQYFGSQLNYKVLPLQEVDKIDNLTWIEINNSTGKEKLRSFTVLFFIVFVIVFFIGDYIIKKSKKNQNIN